MTESNNKNEASEINESSWQTLKNHEDYEININYPHQIRKKSNKKIIKETLDIVHGYLLSSLNGRLYRKHRLIAEQFIINPDNLTEVDHINHNRTDNHIENLRWVSHKDNIRNVSGHNHKYVFLDELSDTVESLDSYNGHDLDGVYIDYEIQKLYLYNGIRYRELIPCRNNGNICYYIRDIENRRIKIYHKTLFE